MADLNPDYPNPGEYFQAIEPVEQKEERQNEEGAVKEGVRLLELVLNRLDDRIKFYGSIDSIEADLSERPAIHQRKLYANQIIKRNLEQERQYYATLKDQYVK